MFKLDRPIEIGNIWEKETDQYETARLEIGSRYRLGVWPASIYLLASVLFE